LSPRPSVVKQGALCLDHHRKQIVNVPARAGILTLLAYIATIPAANLAVTHFGVVPVGLGYTAPAGVYMVGLALVLRDLAREAAGRGAVLTAIAIGTLLAYLLADPNLATASAIAFAVAETMDFAVYGVCTGLSGIRCDSSVWPTSCSVG
jgi:uncharacterized PurR-regulated membrane protein YhhQ (DUF165 family)